MRSIYINDMNTIRRIVAEAISTITKRSLGNCVALTPKRITDYVGINVQPVTLTLIKYFLDLMVKHGDARIIERTRSRFYYLCKHSEIWGKDKDYIIDYLNKLED